MAERRGDEFYVGYLPQAPRGVAARARTGIVLILAVAVVVAAMLVLAQRRFAASVFEYGITRELTGVITEHPYPILWVPRPHDGRSPDLPPTVSGYLLVAFGKHGAAELAEGRDRKRVRVSGSLIYRDNRTMIEVHEIDDESGGPIEPTWMPPPAEDLGGRSLIGEIIDTKCFLGVMKPGNLKPHRACAVRCISGGIPPALVVRDAAGVATYYLLASPDGKPANRAVLDHIAEPIRIEGRVLRYGDLLVLRGVRSHISTSDAPSSSEAGPM